MTSFRKSHEEIAPGEQVMKKALALALGLAGVLFMGTLQAQAQMGVGAAHADLKKSVIELANNDQSPLVEKVYRRHHGFRHFRHYLRHRLYRHHYYHHRYYRPYYRYSYYRYRRPYYYRRHHYYRHHYYGHHGFGHHGFGHHW